MEVNDVSDVISGVLLGRGWTMFTWRVLREPEACWVVESEGG